MTCAQIINSNKWDHFTVCKQMSNIKENYLWWVTIFETIKLLAKKLPRLKIMVPTNYSHIGFDVK